MGVLPQLSDYELDSDAEAGKHYGPRGRCEGLGAEKAVMSERLPDSLPAREPSRVVPTAATGVQEKPAPERVDQLPPFRVLLHNDEVNDFVHVIETICDLTPLTPQRAAAVTMEAHKSGVALVLTTHKERAELYQDQFQSKLLKVTIEPAT